MLQYIIDRLIEEGIVTKDFYGKVILVFENGKVNYIKKEETIKIKKPKSGG